MKKLLCILLALLMLGCTAFAEGVNYAGVWVLTGLETEGVRMGPESLAASDMSLTLTLNEDGTCVLDTVEAVVSGGWYVTEGVLYIDDGTEVVAFTYADDMLIVEDEGGRMMLTREGAAPAVTGTTNLVILTGVPAEAFEGVWALATVESLDMEASVGAVGTYVFLELDDGVGLYIQMDANGEAIQEKITYEVLETEDMGTVLVLIYQSESMETAVELMALNMLEDGRLTCEMDVDGAVASYYFINITEQATEAE